MPRQRLTAHAAAVALAAASLWGAAPQAQAADLAAAFVAAQQHDRSFAAERAAHDTAQPRRDQAAALWRPGVQFQATAGLGSSETDTRGAQFGAPGLGTSQGVDFSTSVNGGASTRWALQASQPLYNPQRRAQQRQLNTAAEVAERSWQVAGQQLAQRVAQAWFGLALARESLAVLDAQLTAVQRISQEAQDRYDLGDAPITATHEARARLALLRAQRLAAQNDVAVKERLLTDLTGLPVAALEAHAPAQVATDTTPLPAWQAEAEAHNLQLALQQLAVDNAQAAADRQRAGSSASVDLVAQVGQERIHGSGDYGSARSKATNALVGVQLTVPLWTGGMQDAREREAIALLEKERATLDAVREQVAQNVHTAWLQLATGAERVRALAEALAASSERLAATQLGQEVGDRTLLDVLSAENDQAAARLQLAQARTDWLLARLQLATLSGRPGDVALQALTAAMTDSGTKSAD